MRFILFVEGHTEQKTVPAFLKRWLDPRLSQPVGVKPVRFEGWPEYMDDVAGKARKYLTSSTTEDVLGVVGLLDLYGPTFYPDDTSTANDRVEWASTHIERLVGHQRFRQFFAVHEIEAWLLSQPDIFQNDVQKLFPRTTKTPESVNWDNPPSHMLDHLFKRATRRKYKKIVHGCNLFAKLDPDVAYAKCPNLKRLLDAMLEIAKQAGL